MDKRELKIIMQNSMAHATQLSMHNSGGKPVDVGDVVALARQILAAVLETGEMVEEDERKSTYAKLK